MMRRNGPAVIGQLPCAPGVYRFRDAGGRVLYVGPATTLRSRVASYWSDLRDREHLGPMVARVARIEAVACDSAHEAAWLERNLLETSLPRWNRSWPAADRGSRTRECRTRDWPRSGTRQAGGSERYGAPTGVVWKVARVLPHA